MQPKRVFLVVVSVITLIYFIGSGFTAASGQRGLKLSTLGVSEQQLDLFIASQAGLSPDRKLALRRYAHFLQAILDNPERLPFDELRETACITQLSLPFDSEYEDLELLVKGKVLNSAEKIRKYYANDAKWSGKLIDSPQVTRDECL